MCSLSSRFFLCALRSAVIASAFTPWRPLLFPRPLTVCFALVSTCLSVNFGSIKPMCLSSVWVRLSRRQKPLLILLCGILSRTFRSALDPRSPPFFELGERGAINILPAFERSGIAPQRYQRGFFIQRAEFLQS